MDTAKKRVSLTFDADTSQAKKEIQSLARELDLLSTKKIASSFTQDINKDIKEAAYNVGQFSSILKSAVNVDTGKLDLAKFNQGLTAANTNLPKMAESFKALGADGIKAFAGVVKQINAAEVPLKKTNAMVDKLWTSMKNTMNWQISSTALHALMSGIQGAFHYAQDLNTSLNNIRIVTGASAEEMAAFAAEANKAAKALNTTTTAYTDASLIYFQQGLSKEEVKERADVTIKMANVTRQSATEVSNQLTSIWNNFDDGTKSLEYYADVLTKLGAATASSTDEIAGGLEKFAAVADTIGLSYEYAASALATITSNTRQSEEVVGTALKTIFARIQGLNLGDTLEDGTTLNKYSEALQKVGISIFDSTGQMKKMDNILDEMGAKWQSLSKDQQVALAQTVAGVRQYNQLVSLMDNWNNGDSDSMSANLATAYNASGALTQQSDIYAESWEAASKRVRASAEAIYDALLDDEFFIDLMDGASGLLDIIKNAIEGLGGVKGLLATISTYVLTIARTQIGDELKRLTGPSQKKQAEMAEQMKSQANQTLGDMTKSSTTSKEAEVTAATYNKIASAQERLRDNANRISDVQRNIVNDSIKQYEILGNIVAEKAKSIDAGAKELRSLERQLAIQERIAKAQRENKIAAIESVQGSGNLLNRRSQQFSDEDINKVNEARSAAGLDNLSEEQQQILTADRGQMSDEDKVAHLKNYQTLLAQINSELDAAKQKILSISFKPLTQSLNEYRAKSEQVGAILENLYPKEGAFSAEKLKTALNGLDEPMKQLIIKAAGGEEAFNKLVEQLNNADGESEEVTAAIEDLANVLDQVRAEAANTVVKDTGLNAEQIHEATMRIDEEVDSMKELNHAQNQLGKSGQKIDEQLDTFPAKTAAWQDQLVAAAGAVSSLSMAFSSLKGLWNTLQDPDMSAWEKVGTVFTTLGTVIPALVMTWGALKDAKVADTIETWLNTAASWANAASKEAEADANLKAAGAQGIETASDATDTAGDVVGGVVDKVDDVADAVGDAGEVITKSGGKLKAFFSKLGAGLKNIGTKILGGVKKVWGALKGVITKFGAGIAVAAVIITGCVHVYNALSDAYNKNEIAAQKAEAAATNLAATYDEVRGTFEELKTTISSYQDARNGLDSLTRGTVEFSESISNANDEALKLLNTYGDLIGNRYEVDGDGLIKIDEDALEDIKKQEYDKVQQARGAQILSQRQAREARLLADETQMHRDIVKGKEGFTAEDGNETGKAAAVTTGVGAAAGLGVGIGMAATGATIGAAAGSAVPVVGTLIGAAAGLIIGGITGLIVNAVDKNSETDTEKEAFDTLTEQYKLDGASALTDDNIKKLYKRDDMSKEEIEAIRELCKEVHANTIATEAENRAMAAQVLSDNEKVQNSRDAEEVAIFAGDAYGKASTEALNTYMSDDYQANFWGKGSDKQKDAWKRYAEAQGLGNLKDYKVTDYRKDGGVEYSYTDENGKKQKKVVTQEEWAAVVAAQDADAATNEAASNIVDILDKLDKSSVGLLTGAKTSDMSKLKMGELAGGISQDIQNMSLEDLQALGFEGDSKQDILDQIARQQQKSINDIKDTASLYGSSVGTLVDEMIKSNDESIKNVTQETLKSYAGTLSTMMSHGGTSAMEAFDTGLQGLMDNYSHKSEEIMSLANTIDWSKGQDALQDFNAQLMAMGINVNESSAEWKAMVTAMQQMNTSVVHRDLDSIRGEITNIKKIAESIEIGSIISDEDYNTLIGYKAELADLFLMTADGYKFIGGGNVQEIAQQAALDKLKKTQEDNKKAKNAYNALNAWGWTDGKNFTKEDWYGMANGTDSYEKMSSMLNAIAGDTNGKAAIEALGFNVDYLKEMAGLGADATDEQKKAAKEQMQKFYQEILTLNANKESGVYDDKAANEVYLSTASNLQQLKSMAKDASISTTSEEYKKAFRGLANESYASATSLTELNAALDEVRKVGGSRSINWDDYRENVKRITEENAAAAQSLEELDKIWEDGSAMGGTLLDQKVYIENVKRITEASAESATSIEELNRLWAEGKSKGASLDTAVYVDNVKRLAEEGAGAANSLQELQNVMTQAAATGVAIDSGIYAENLLRLSESYAICADEAKAFQYALQSGDAALRAAAQEALEATLMLAEAADKYGVSQEELSVQSQQFMEASKDVNGEYTLNAKQAATLTIQNQRMNKGVETLVGSWEDWKKELKSGNKTSRDWAKAAADCTKVIADLVGASEDLELPADFFDSADNMALLEKAANGDAKAIAKLGVIVAKTQVEMMNFHDGMQGLKGQLIDEAQFTTWKDTLLTGITDLQNALSGLSIGEDVYEKLGGDDWVNALNQMAIATGMSVDEMNSLLNSMGVQAEVTTTDVEQKVKVPVYRTYQTNQEYDDNGTLIAYDSKTVQTGTETMDGVVQVAQINTGDNVGTPPKINYIGNGNVSNSATNGDSAGSSSTTKTKDSRGKKTDIVDRYKEINDEMEETQRLMKKNSTLAEGLWGAARASKLRENIKLMEAENAQLARKYEMSKAYLAEDKSALQAAAKAAGVNFTFNDDGNISNYTDQMTALFNARERLLDSFGSEMNEKEQERLEEFDKKVDALKEAYQQYETTLDEKKDMEEEHLEKILAIQTEYYNLLNEELEVKLSINEDDMQLLEYYLGKMADDFYQMAEAAALMVGSLSDLEEGNFGGQLGNYLSNLDYQKEQLNELERLYNTINPATGEAYINQQQYVEGIREVKSAILENLNSINELDESMMNYYGETLAAGAEELAKFTEKMEAQTAVLEHYSSIMDVLGKSQDYERMGVILEAQAHTIDNEAKVAKENYDMISRQAQARKAAYEAAKAEGASENELELLEKQWWDAEQAATEAQESMLSKTEEWAEAMKAVIENELSGLAQTLENALTADFGGSFDAMSTMLTRANSLQEEYLTTTNQIYETNKMMRTAQQEIDKSTNSVAKRKLKSFIDETEQLQNQSKLSKYELEIQQAKYDLLLAEIALEEASNAKSTVRLKRDSEGNFGYVYTADNNAVDEAAQKFEDAQNNLYNIGLDGANNYTEKYQQTLSEFYDTMTELQTQHLNGEFENEAEYQAAMESARQYYYAKLQEYSSLYTIALSTDARVVEDAWSTEFQSMTLNTEQWMTNVDTYVAGVEDAFARWEAQMATIEEETIGSDLDALKEKTKGITDESDALVTKITEDGGVIDSLEAEYDAVVNLTGAYATLREQLAGVIGDYEAMMQAINDKAEAESQDDGSDDTSSTPPPVDNTTEDTSSDTGSGQTASWDKVYAAYKKINSGAWGNGMQRRISAGKAEGFTEEEVRLGQQLINKVYGGMALEAAKAAIGFDTGGYTGDWGGSYGKLAMLHQKELILNPGDTENFLAGMEVLNKIVQAIDLYSMNAQLGGLLTSPSYSSYGSGEVLEQQVHIEASFPNVTDRHEIEDALNTLVNRASQYASRK